MIQLNEIERRLLQFEQSLLRIDDLEQKVLSLEKEVSQKSVVHEISTIPCTSQANDESDMIQTHKTAEFGRVFVVPFKFSGKMFLRKISAICSAESESSTQVGLALYALDNPRVIDQDNPLSGSFSYLRKMHKEVWASPSGVDHVRLDISYPARYILESSRSLYFAAWTIEADEGRIFCPNACAGSVSFDATTKTFNSAYKTNGVVEFSGSNQYVFPDRLTIITGIDKPAAPCVIARSRIGLRAYGSFTDDV